MDEIQNISKRVEALPKELQRQILDYIEFIISRYQPATELSELLTANYPRVTIFN